MILDDVIAKMACAFSEKGTEWSSSIAEGEIWVHFEKTPGSVIIDENRKVKQIDIFQTGSIS